MLKSLEKLDLCSNDFTSLPESVLECQALQELLLDNNKLSSLPDNIVSWISNVKKVVYEIMLFWFRFSILDWVPVSKITICRFIFRIWLLFQFVEIIYFICHFNHFHQIQIFASKIIPIWVTYLYGWLSKLPQAVQINWLRRVHGT